MAFWTSPEGGCIDVYSPAISGMYDCQMRRAARPIEMVMIVLGSACERLLAPG